MVSPPPESPQPVAEVPLRTVFREWGRIGCIGFGGPPAHIRLLRQLCVERKGWMDGRTFEDAIAVCNLLPGPASTQLAIFCAWRLRGRLGALIGGAAFIVPGLIVILALSVLFLAGSPPLWVLGAGAGAGAAVPAVAVNAGVSLIGPSWRNRRSAVRWLLYLAAGLAAAATVGEWLVVVLLGCGAVELASRSRRGPAGSAPDDVAGNKLRSVIAAPALLAARAPAVLAAGAAVTAGTLASVAWEAFKVGALSFGGGFVIIPLMQADAVNHYHWMTGAQFLNAVALGQVTPGPVVQTVAVIGYAAAGIGAGLLASAVAFTPSFAFVLFGGPRFEQIRGNARARAFLDGAGPTAIGAILGSAITLGRALSHPWQYAVLACALALLIPLRRGVVVTLLGAAAVGVLIALAAGTVSPLLAPFRRLLARYWPTARVAAQIGHLVPR
jgi:chromate transporter